MGVCSTDGGADAGGAEEPEGLDETGWGEMGKKPGGYTHAGLQEPGRFVLVFRIRRVVCGPTTAVAGT